MLTLKRRPPPELLEDTLVASPVSPARLLELAKIFEKATLLEIAFWDAAILAHRADQTAQRLDMPH